MSVSRVSESLNPQNGDLMECPYSSLHKVSVSKFGNHIFRCRNNYEKGLKAKGEVMRLIHCRWNAFHLLPPPESAYHEVRCPDRGVSKWKAFEPSEVRNQVADVKSRNHLEVEMAFEEENWEEEIDHGAKTVFQYPVIRKDQYSSHNPTLLNKTEKKTWTTEQREKFRAVSATDPKWVCSAPDVPSRSTYIPPIMTGTPRTWTPKTQCPSQTSHSGQNVAALVNRKQAENASKTRINSTRSAETIPRQGRVRFAEALLPDTNYDHRGGGNISIYMEAAGSSDEGLIDKVEGGVVRQSIDSHAGFAHCQSDNSDDEFFDAKSSVDD
ncbi:unnamed protein product [Allacma fusca]|uniref:CHHC U11-48K-type domain-containing protein n=2 Tax=Allacma fusca TaxID=39272 RepID=A0A8J2JLB0_9HEXA|nr:unnamed protein product [Allacma fusca]